MKNFFTILLILLLVTAATGTVFAQSYHSFGRNPMLPGGLRQPAQGAQFMPTPHDIPAVRMWGASGESSVKILPAGTLCEVYKQGNLFVASRVVICGNTLQGASWPAGQQAQAQQIVVNVNFVQPEQKPDYTVYGNARIAGASYGQPWFLQTGGVMKRTVTWSDTNVKVDNSANNSANNSNSVNNSNTQSQGQHQGQNQHQTTTNSNTSIDVNNNSNSNTNNNNNNNVNQNSNVNSNANAASASID